MTTNDYLPILTSTTKLTFFDYADALNMPQIDYIAIGIQNTITKKSISLMSLPTWQKQFIDNQYAAYDPIRRVTLHTKRNLIPFREIDYVDSFGKEIMRQRSIMGVKDGIILMQRFEKFNYMVTLGTSFSKFDAYDFIKRYHNKIWLIKTELIAIIEKDAKNFLSKIYLPPTRLSNDAK